MFIENKVWTEVLGAHELKGNWIKIILWSYSIVMFFLSANFRTSYPCEMNFATVSCWATTVTNKYCLNILETWYKTENACRQIGILWLSQTYLHNSEMVWMTTQLPSDFLPIPEEFLTSSIPEEFLTSPSIRITV